MRFDLDTLRAAFNAHDEYMKARIEMTPDADEATAWENVFAGLRDSGIEEPEEFIDNLVTIAREQMAQYNEMAGLPEFLQALMPEPTREDVVEQAGVFAVAVRAALAQAVTE